MRPTVSIDLCRFASAAGLLAALIVAAPAEAADACRFAPVKIEAADKGKFDRYAGRGKTVEIELSNSGGKPTDTFSDPPLRIRPVRGGKDCGIDAGNWVRKHIYLSHDERFLLTYEFSGSSSELVIYETATCARKDGFDVSGATWSVDGGAITIGAHCRDEARKNCVQKKVLRFDAQCVPLSAQ